MMSAPSTFRSINDGLVSITGFNVLETMGSLNIESNGALESVTGFTALETVTRLFISNNAALTSIAAWAA